MSKETPQNRAQAIEPGQQLEIDLLTPEDAPKVADLFRTVYGEGYPMRTYYEPDELILANQEGRIISSVARTENGDIVGHNALFQHVPYKGVYESGAGLVLPSYRAGNLFGRMVSHGPKAAAGRFAVETIFGEPVCNHVFSQKMCHAQGWITMALELDLMPAAAYDKEKSAKGRVAATLMFASVQKKPHQVYVPDGYEDTIRFLYDAFDDKRELQPAGSALPPGGESGFDVRFFDFAQLARISVLSADSGFETSFAQEEARLLAKGIEVVQVWLDLSWPWVGEICAILKRRGYVLGGVLPRWFDHDGLLMQRTVKEPDWNGINLYYQRDKELLERVRDEWRENNAS